MQSVVVWPAGHRVALSALAHACCAHAAAVKDRIGYAMIVDAEEAGKISPGKVRTWSASIGRWQGITITRFLESFVPASHVAPRCVYEELSEGIVPH